MLTFELQGQPFITLNNLLKVMGLVETGGEANVRIANGEVKVNLLTELQKRKKLITGDLVVFKKASILIAP